MGVPPEMDVHFLSVEEAGRRLASLAADGRPGILLTGDIDTMQRLASATGLVRRVNLGGIHHRAGRTQRMRYIFLSPEEERALRALAASGVEVVAQDVPSARVASLDEVLGGREER